jgi:hypothetical protein
VLLLELLVLLLVLMQMRRQQMMGEVVEMLQVRTMQMYTGITGSCCVGK